jgi:DNA invertase Pin-like site-specific DNA recombinase
MVAEFEADLIRARTREGMKVARAKGRLRGKQLKPSELSAWRAAGADAAVADSSLESSARTSRSTLS